MTAQPVHDFFRLTPDRVLDAVEESGHRTTGLCYPLNSLENRVYEVELDDGRRLVAKFYRPRRWTRETILDEHRLLAALRADEIPVCAPAPFPDGATLHENGDGIFFALFPRTGGRSPEDLSEDQLEQLGRLLARIHNVSAALDLRHRPAISPETYGTDCLAVIRERGGMPPALLARYAAVAEELVSVAAARWPAGDAFVLHGDCHRANLLCGRDGWFFLDFDDAGRGPAVQDLWLLLPARPRDCPAEVEALLRGYEQFRDFDHATLGLVELLRGLRYVRYAAWVAQRWDDPAFRRAFPDWGSERYWQGQLSDLHEQLALVRDAP